MLIEKTLWIREMHTGLRIDRVSQHLFKLESLLQVESFLTRTNEIAATWLQLDQGTCAHIFIS